VWLGHDSANRDDQIQSQNLGNFIHPILLGGVILSENVFKYFKGYYEIFANV